MLTVSPVDRYDLPSKECPRYNTKMYLMVRLQFWRFGECAVLFHLLPGPLLSGVTSMGQIVSTVINKSLHVTLESDATLALKMDSFHNTKNYLTTQINNETYFEIQQ